MKEGYLYYLHISFRGCLVTISRMIYVLNWNGADTIYTVRLVDTTRVSQSQSLGSMTTTLTTTLTTDLKRMLLS